MTSQKKNQKIVKHTPTLTTFTENPKPKSQKFSFQCKLQNFDESFEGLNSSLA